MRAFTRFVMVSSFVAGPILALPMFASPVRAAGPKPMVIEIKVDGMQYVPRMVRVEVGTPVVFRINNTSVVDHEAVLGNDKVQAAHAKEMKEMAAMGMDMGMDMGGMAHDMGKPKPGEGSVTIKAKKSGEIKTTFTKVGRTILGCHFPGHYEGGMRLSVLVTPKSLG